MANENLRSVIQSFQYDEEKIAPVSKVGKPKISPRKSKSARSKPTSHPDPHLKDLPPMISTDLTLLFVGFNPGVESSKQQHHYAHPTNLFWKLFNASDVLSKVLQLRQVGVDDSDLLSTMIYKGGKSNATPQMDQDLVQFGVGFTDLVLRCTKTAQELSRQEKLDNVPRLFSEFTSSNAKWIVVIGKGIWEFIVKYLDPSHKLTKDNFHWGLQTGQLVKRIHKHCGYEPNIYVFPNTSGLVASMKYPEKLALWNDLAASI